MSRFVTALLGCALVVAPALADERIPPFPTDPASSVPFWQRVGDSDGALAAGMAERSFRQRIEVVDPSLAAAEASMRQRWIERLLAEVAAAHRRWPEHLGLLQLEAQLSTDAGHWSQAVAQWDELERRQHKLVPTDLLSRAEALAGAGRPRDALAVLEGIPARGGMVDVATQLVRASILMQDGRADDAAAIYEALIVMGDPIIYLCAAMAYDRAGQLAHVRQLTPRLAELELAVELTPRVGTLMAARPARRQNLSLPFASPGDWRYAMALAAEARGRTAEAMEGWRAYLASASPRYANRARGHLAALSARVEKGRAR